MKQTNVISRRSGTAARIPALSVLLVLLLAGCVGSSLGVGVGVGTGGTGVGVGIGAGSTSVGVGAGGFGVSLNAYGDFLNNGPNEAYLNNKAGIKQLNDGNYEAARKIFTDTLEKYPDLPDSTYYLGLTLIYLDKRETGFGLLKTYREPLYYRATSAVQRMAAYLEKKPELTAEKIHKTMNRERREGFDRDLRERMELRRGI
jgi:tetratricopeptide (TPR) repeat protein